jgi:hypothetical protein
VTLVISPAVQEACLANPRQLYAALTRWAATGQGAASGSGGGMQQSTGPQEPPAYPPLTAALACLTGRCGGEQGPDGGSEVLTALLAYADPTALPLCWLLVRAMLDEQVSPGEQLALWAC